MVVGNDEERLAGGHPASSSFVSTEINLGYIHLQKREKTRREAYR